MPRTSRTLSRTRDDGPRLIRLKAVSRCRVFAADPGVAVICAAAMLLAASAPTTLPTGVRLDPVGESIDLGSMPLAMALSPEGDKLVVALSGWREQGIQIVDLASKRVTQTLRQEAAFFWNRVCARRSRAVRVRRQ